MSSPLVIVLGLSPTGLYAIRELGQAGFAVLGIDDHFQAGCLSRFLGHPDRYKLTREADETLAYVLTVANTWDGPVILQPTSDRYIEWLASNNEELGVHCCFAGAYSDGKAMQLLDKDCFAQLCSEHNVAGPEQTACSAAGLREPIEKLRLPLLLKPVRIHQQRELMKGKKVFVITAAEQIDPLLHKLQAHPGDWLVQEIIPGPDSNISLYAGDFSQTGTVRGRFSGRKLRQYPPGFGSASLVDNERVAAAEETSEKLLLAHGFRGIAGAEFKYDERDQQLKIIEINPRPTLWFDITRRAGVGLVSGSVAGLCGEEPLPPSQSYPGPLRWRYLLKDSWSRCFYATGGRNWVLPPPDIKPLDGRRPQHVGPIWDATDPAPVLGELINYTRKGLGRALSQLGLS